MKNKLKIIYNIILVIIIDILDTCAVLFVIYNIGYITIPLIEQRDLPTKIIYYIGAIPIFIWLLFKLNKLFTKGIYEKLSFEIYE